MQGVDSMKFLTAIFVLLLFAAVELPAAWQDRSDESSVPRITLDEFKKLLESDSIVVLDVRSLESYREGHIPGAISMPSDSVTSRVNELKGFKKPIVAYCS
jgi:3-mercaptopyruvate sulfurtransferase SseA